MEYNIYCDESCHLENDGIKTMVLGAIWCNKDRKDDIFRQLRNIKSECGLCRAFEIKWNKVSPGGQDFYIRTVNYFFDDKDLHFRALVVSDKTMLKHSLYNNQTHDDFYYKMYFNLLKVILSPSDTYNIFLDVKDSRSQDKVLKLAEMLRNNHYDFDKKIVKRIQQVRSHETELLPLADLLVGAIGYHHRGLHDNAAKIAIINLMQERSRYTLNNSTLYREDKLNLFVWKSKHL